MRRNFRTLERSVELYRLCKNLCLPRHLKDQLDRAASSVVLNISEGSGRETPKDQRRFYTMAMGSLRETQAILLLADKDTSDLSGKADCVGAHLYKLIKSMG
jgi:four helix bundle protein